MVSIVIPTLNEAENIDPLLERLCAAIEPRAFDAEILVVDDGSTDGTRERVRAWAQRANMRLIARDHERGLAGAVLAGARAARGSVVVVIDADLSHPPERLPALVEPVLAGERDLVIGSRHVRGGSIPDWPVTRRIASRLASLLAWPLVDVRDPMSGYFAVRRDRLLDVDLDAKGYKIGLEILAAGGPDLRVSEVPIVFHDRAHGESKLDTGVLLAYLDRLRALAGGDVSVRTASRFAAVGFMGMLLDLAVFQGLYSLGWAYTAAQVISFLVATAFNFTLNARWSFGITVDAGSPGRRRAALFGYIRYLTVALLALALRGAVLGALVEGLGIPPRVAILGAIAAVAVVNYAGATFFVFAKPKAQARADIRWRVAAVGVVAYVLALRLLYIGAPDLLIEEAYYWNYAQHPALSYLDHPPMVAWLIGAGTWLFGDSEFGVRIGAVLCGVVMVVCVYRLTRLQWDKSTALRAALLATALPFFFFSGFFMTPDAPLAAAWAGALLFLYDALVRGRGRAWWGVGLCAGLGLLSKYTIGLLGPATLVFILLDRRTRRWLLDPRPYLAAALAALVWSPVIIWNARHGWASFRFQTVERVAEPFYFGLPRLIGAMLIVITPLGVIAAWCAVWALRGRGPKPLAEGEGPAVEADPARRTRLFGAVFTLVPLSVFIVFSLGHEPKLNWTGPIWLAALPLIAHGLIPAARRPFTARRSTLARLWPPMLALCLVAYGLSLHYVSLGFPGLGYPAGFRLVGWRELAEEVERIEDRIEAETGAEPVVVGMDKYGIASELAFYRTVTGAAVDSHDPREGVTHTVSRNVVAGSGLMYDLWFSAGSFDGATMILVARRREDLTRDEVVARFDRVTEPAALAYDVNGKAQTGYFIGIGYGYRATPR